MKTNLEIEYKTLITQTEFERIQAAFPFAQAQVQTNVYFDTPEGALFDKKMMCRIRIIDNRYEFTLKIPQTDGVMEFEYQLDSLSLDHPAIRTYFESLNLDALLLKETTRSETHRQIYEDTYGEWCLDETNFSHHKDYEIEYELFEANKKAYPHYVSTLKSLNIVSKEAQPKYIRALSSSQ